MIGSVTQSIFRHRRQPAEVQRDNDRDENPEQKNELALRDQIGLAGLIDQFGNFAHRAMNRQVLQLHIDRQAEQQAADAEEQSDHQKGMSVHAEKIHGRQIRQYQVGFASARVFRLRVGECGKQQATRGRHDLVLALQKCFSAFLDGAGDFCISGVPLSEPMTWRAKKRPQRATKRSRPERSTPSTGAVTCPPCKFWLPFYRQSDDRDPTTFG